MVRLAVTTRETSIQMSEPLGVDREKIVALILLAEDHDANGGSWWDKHLSKAEHEAAERARDHWRPYWTRLEYGW